MFVLHCNSSIYSFSRHDDTRLQGNTWLSYRPERSHRTHFSLCTGVCWLGRHYLTTSEGTRVRHILNSRHTQEPTESQNQTGNRHNDNNNNNETAYNRKQITGVQSSMAKQGLRHVWRGVVTVQMNEKLRYN